MGRLQTARLENFIRRWGSMKGGGSVLSETLGDVFPTLDLQNLAPDNYALAGWYPFFIFGSVIGIAAQQTGISLINPANSGHIVVVDGFILRLEVGSRATIGTSLPLFTPFVLSSAARDTRLAARTGNATLGGNANVGAAENGMIVQLAGNVDREIILPHGTAILAPGTQLAVVTSTVNVDTTASFFGHVRIAEPSELSF